MSQQPYDPSPPPYGPPPPKGKGPLVAGIATVLVLLVVVAGLVIVLLTRDGDDDPGPVAEPTTRTPSEKPSPDSEDPTDAPSTGSGGSGGSGDAGDLTPPGTTLALGESATVPVTNGPGANGVVKLTVTDIRQGTSEDLANVKIDDFDASEHTPFYVEVEVEVVSQDGNGLASFTPGAMLQGVIDGSRTAAQLTAFGDFPVCEVAFFASDVQPGATLKSCLPLIADKGDVVDRVVFASSGGDYDLDEGEPVTWR